MLDPNSIEDIAKKLADSAPSLDAVRQDIETGLHTVFNEMLEKLNLVSREEFDVQTAVLAKTRQKLEQLEQTVSELEQTHLSSKQHNSSEH
ncbi:MAG TPA: accessory factor UbiK family protein [Crenotrichaceae bacterium]|nr:accessory factor UbiK family protein [Crenotrichaceae bacterium]